MLHCLFSLNFSRNPTLSLLPFPYLYFLFVNPFLVHQVHATFVFNFLALHALLVAPLIASCLCLFSPFLAFLSPFISPPLFFDVLCLVTCSSHINYLHSNSGLLIQLYISSNFSFTGRTVSWCPFQNHGRLACYRHPRSQQLFFAPRACFRCSSRQSTQSDRTTRPTATTQQRSPGTTFKRSALIR